MRNWKQKSKSFKRISKSAQKIIPIIKRLKFCYSFENVKLINLTLFCSIILMCNLKVFAFDLENYATLPSSSSSSSSRQLKISESLLRQFDHFPTNIGDNNGNDDSERAFQTAEDEKFQNNYFNDDGSIKQTFHSRDTIFDSKDVESENEQTFDETESKIESDLLNRHKTSMQRRKSYTEQFSADKSYTPPDISSLHINTDMRGLSSIHKF